MRETWKMFDKKQLLVKFKKKNVALGHFSSIRVFMLSEMLWIHHHIMQTTVVQWPSW